MYPRLDDIVQADDVSQKGKGNFAASYVNWSRIAHYLREHAPGWQPFAQPDANGCLAHTAPDGTAFMLIGFRYRAVDDDGVLDADPGTTTELVPHAIMDHKMNAKKNPSARDIADAYVRGMCKAAALLFGLGWRLWSKDDPFERDDDQPQRTRPKSAAPPPEPFSDPLQAADELGRCTAQEQVDAWAMRVKVSAFASEELDALREATKERRAQIADGEAA